MIFQLVISGNLMNFRMVIFGNLMNFHKVIFGKIMIISNIYILSKKNIMKIQSYDFFNFTHRHLHQHP